MSTALYHDAIVAAARDATGAGRLSQADVSASVDNPLCGDRVALDLCSDGERVTALGHQVRGCLLCEAAASIIGRCAPGETVGDLRELPAQVASMMRHGGEAPAGHWQVMDAFLPVRDYKSRHDCVLLPFEALTLALQKLPR